MVSPHTVDVSAINDEGGTLQQASRSGNHRGRAMGVHIGMIAKPENTVENGLANALYLSWAGASSSMSSSLGLDRIQGDGATSHPGRYSLGVVYM